MREAVGGGVTWAADPGLESLFSAGKESPVSGPVGGNSSEGLYPGREENERRVSEPLPFSTRDSSAASGWLMDQPLTGHLDRGPPAGRG